MLLLHVWHCQCSHAVPVNVSGKQSTSNSYAQSDDDIDDPFYPLSQSQLSTSTPEIFRNAETESLSSVRDSRLMGSNRRNARTRTLPQPPSKAMSFTVSLVIISYWHSLCVCVLKMGIVEW